MLDRSAQTQSAINLSRLYRAFVSSANYRHPERTVFIEACSQSVAQRKIAEVIAVLELCKPEDVLDSIYNVSSAQELIDGNLSDDLELRLFECGWNGQHILYVDTPICLVRDPAPLVTAWMKTRTPPAEVRPALSLLRHA